VTAKRKIESLIDKKVVEETTAEFANANVTKAEFWTRGLIRNQEGNPRKLVANVMHVLELHPECAGVFAYDSFKESVVLTKAPPMREQDRPSEYELGAFTETDATRISAWFQDEIGIDATREMVIEAVVAVAEKHKKHPVREYLRALRWDSAERLEMMLPRYFGAPDNKYTRAIGRKFMIGAVARVEQPGCKADTMIVLEGKQGTFKSTAAKVLAVDWYADTGVTIGEKDSYQALRGVWLYEFAELAGVKASAVERVKNFLSSASDHYRPSYGRGFRDFPRQTVFIATTNEENYLVDRTGNRRFWPVRCGKVDVDALKIDRDQLWAEAVHLYNKGEKWHIDSLELAALCEAEQAERQAPDDWVPLVEEWLKSPTVPDPTSVGRDIVRRRLVVSEGVTTDEVLLGAIQMRPAELTSHASVRAGKVLRELGFTPRQKREHGERIRRYVPPVTPVTGSDRATCDTTCDTDPGSTQPEFSTSQVSHVDQYAHIQEGDEGSVG